MGHLVRKCEALLLILIISGCSITGGFRSSGQSSAKKKTPTVPTAIHTVKPGENLYRIALYYYDSSSVEETRKYAEKIKKANGLSRDELSIGQKLTVPGTKKKQPSTALVPPDRPAPTTKQETPTTETTVIPPNREITSIIKNTPFIWPVTGKIICRYGELDNQGIDIMTAPAETVSASRDGEVVFVGMTQKYDDTIIIEHDDGYFTVYGHDLSADVVKKEKVKKGGAIAHIKSGSQKQRYLHFEIRKGTSSYDPLRFLPPKE